VADHFTPLFPHSRDSSFPSATAGYFAVAAIPAACAWRKLWWLFAAIAIEVAFGCVYVGVHYVTDVVAGAAIGLAGGGLAWAVTGIPPVLRLPGRSDKVGKCRTCLDTMTCLHLRSGVAAAGVSSAKATRLACLICRLSRAFWPRPTWSGAELCFRSMPS
jgi:hypothetical protein